MSDLTTCKFRKSMVIHDKNKGHYGWKEYGREGEGAGAGDNLKRIGFTLLKNANV